MEQQVLQITIPLEMYTFEQAAKKLGTSQNRQDFVKDHIANGLQVTNLNGRQRISSIELTRYVMAKTQPVTMISENPIKHRRKKTKV